MSGISSRIPLACRIPLARLVLASVAWTVSATAPNASFAPGHALAPNTSRGSNAPPASAPAIPDELWVIPFDSSRAAAAEMVLAESLQGLTGRDSPHIWLDKPSTMSAVILRQLEDEGTVLNRLSSVWELPDAIWRSVTGAILYNLPAGDGTRSSLNAAASLCGPWHAVAIDESILDAALEKGLSVIYDARGQSEDAILNDYSELFQASGIAAEQTDAKPAYLLDFAIQNNAFAFYGLGSTFRRQVAETVGPGATFFGWGPGPSGQREYTYIADLSLRSGQGVASDWCVNLSALAKLPADIPPRLPPAADPAKDGERIVAFVLSDGDNMQWLTNGMPTDQRWFGSDLRGEFPMTWEISPLLATYAPRVLKYLFDNATEQDDFVAAGSPGYRYIHLEPDTPDGPKGTTDARQTGPALDTSGLSIVSVINDNGGSLDEMIPLLDRPEVGGVIYKAYSPYNRLDGAMLCHQDDSGTSKFAVSYKFLLWEDKAGASPQEVADAIGQMPNAPRDEKGSYALINVHAWSWRTSSPRCSICGPIDAARQTIELLPENTRVVTAGEFFALLGQNFSCGNGILAARRGAAQPIGLRWRGAGPGATRWDPLDPARRAR